MYHSTRTRRRAKEGPVKAIPHSPVLVGRGSLESNGPCRPFTYLTPLARLLPNPLSLPFPLSSFFLSFKHIQTLAVSLVLIPFNFPYCVRPLPWFLVRLLFLLPACPGVALSPLSLPAPAAAAAAAVCPCATCLPGPPQQELCVVASTASPKKWQVEGAAFHLAPSTALLPLHSRHRA